MWTLGPCHGKEWKGHLGVLVTSWILVTGFLRGGGGVSVTIWQSVGPPFSCKPPGGVAPSFCPVERNMQVRKQAWSQKQKGDTLGGSRAERVGERTREVSKCVWKKPPRSNRMKHEHISWPSSPTLRNVSKRNECIYLHKTTSGMFIAALFILALTWKQDKCPSVGEWLTKLCMLMTRKQWDGRDTATTAWRHPTGATLSKRT